MLGAVDADDSFNHKYKKQLAKKQGKQDGEDDGKPGREDEFGALTALEENKMLKKRVA